jgi:hypothetical protein
VVVFLYCVAVKLALLHDAPVKVPHVFEVEELQKAIDTVVGAVVVTDAIEFGLVAEVLFVGFTFTPQMSAATPGLKTYITAVNPFAPAPTETTGLAPHVPLKLHQKTETVWLVPAGV